MKIIFLDIDGVMNCQKAYEDGFCKYTTFDNSDIEIFSKSHYQTFYPPAKELLNKLIEETQAKIVISSTWRVSGLAWLRKVWKNEGMSGEIIDVTPKLHLHTGYSVVRGQEIRDWLRDKGFWHVDWSEEKQLEYMGKSDIENYIIIDDDADMLYEQKEHFVCVLPSPRNMSGFNQQYYEEALDKLNNNIIGLNYT